MKKNKLLVRKIMLAACCAMMFAGTLHAAVPTETNNSIPEDKFTDEIRSADEGVIENYVLNINESHYEELVSCFCDNESMEAFFANDYNQENHVGVYNVLYINNYGLTELEVSENYLEYEDAKVYLLWLNCDVVESNQFYMQGDNYFQVVMATENNKRVFIEFSVVSEDVVYNAIGNNDFLLTESDFQSYIYTRVEMFESLDGYEVIKTDEISSNPMARANYNPTSLTSYVFPSTIRVQNSSTYAIRTLDFKQYCYLVSASEFGRGTNVNSTVHIEALRAFSLCVRNLGWYRTLYSISPNSGYDIKDSGDQKLNWSLETNLANAFPNNISAMDYVWNVMMFDGAKKLFYPDYKAGLYNDALYDKQYPNISNFLQNGSNYLATVENKKYKEILHYYYDRAEGGKLSSGPIIICDNHSRSLLYSTTITGHGNACNTCGHIIYSNHVWANYPTHFRCMVCGYTTTNVIAP